MTTAEYAVGTVAGGAALPSCCYRVVRSPAVSSALSSLIRSALNAQFLTVRSVVPGGEAGRHGDRASWRPRRRSSCC